MTCTKDPSPDLLRRPPSPDGEGNQAARWPAQILTSPLRGESVAAMRRRVRGLERSAKSPRRCFIAPMSNFCFVSGKAGGSTSQLSLAKQPPVRGTMRLRGSPRRGRLPLLHGDFLPPPAS
jgi:hypothetical protein